MKQEKIISVPIEISARHVHLSKQGLEELFGAGYELHKIKQLGQQSDFSSQETIDIIAGDKTIKGARVVGPLRQKTQVEISKTDAVFLGLNPPLRLSGDLKGSAGVVLKGPKGKLELKEGLILARRHLHCSTNQAKELKLKDGDIVCVETEGERKLIFCNIIARVADGYDLCLHIDTDEGNAAGINKRGQGIII
jgi:propanediol utilization protein